MNTVSTISHGATPWLRAGYELFLEEGHEGLQVERLARILGRNKSGFYHFFGERDTYLEFLMRYHLNNLEEFVSEIRRMKSFDPEYSNLLVKHRDKILFSSQLVRNRHIKLFAETVNEVHLRIDNALQPAWAHYLGLDDNVQLAHRYYDIIRDVLYTRISEKMFTSQFFTAIASEAKAIVNDLVKAKTAEAHVGLVA